MLVPGMDPSVEGTLVYPGNQGGTNWYGPTYSPQVNAISTIIVAVVSIVTARAPRQKPVVGEVPEPLKAAA